jgi:non-reducing end alpha-L-arabinofuranosidase
MTGGSSSVGGTVSAAGGAGIGGAVSNAGATSAGGSNSTGGTAGVGGMGGATSAAGSAGAGAAGGGSNGSAPCDIYATGNTPCVAAHSTTRALYSAYSGALYQVRRASDKSTKDVPVLAAGGFVDASVQDTFCNATTCTISVIYDQSPNKNDLVKSGVAHWLPNGGTEANAANGKITLSGHAAHGIYVTGYSGNVAYRNNATKGVAKADQPEAMYMVVDGKRFSNQCCFDYGNAETTGIDDGNGTMEAVYWGSDITWGGTGQGSGPWVAADLENGMFKGDKGGWQSQAINTPSAKSVIASYATAMLKGPSGNHFTLKAGDAQSGTLVTMWDGVRPSPGYSPKKLEGAIILGTGGDGSNGGTGTFFEGAITSGNPSDSVDALVQANIVAAGYGR